MPIVKINGKSVNFPNLAPEELEKAVKAAAGQIVATEKPSVSLVPSAKETVLGGPLNLIPGLVPATAAVGWQVGKISRESPQSALTGIRYGLPMAAGLATGGMGLAPALAVAGATGVVAKDIEMTGQAALGLPGAPETSKEAALEAALAGGQSMAEEVAGRGLARLGKGVINFLKGRMVSAAAKTGVPASEIERVVTQHPDVTKPGYFKERIDTFSSDIEKKLLANQKAAGTKIEKELTKLADKPALTVTDLRSAVDRGVDELGLISETKEARSKLKELYRMVDAIEKKGYTVSFKDLADFERAMYRATKNALPDVARAPAIISSRLDHFYDTAPGLRKARNAYRVASQDLNIASEGLGIKTGKSKQLNDATTIERKVSDFLANPDPVKDTVKETTDRLGGKFTERLEKLSAAGSGEGRLSADVPPLPSVGLGQTGYAVANPGAAAPALAATMAFRKAFAPRLVGSAFRVSQKALPLLPGLGAATTAAVRSGASVLEKKIRARKK